MDVVLSDRMRRLLCRCAFVLLCLLPTIWTLWHVVAPGTAASRANSLSLALGVSVHADSFFFPTPGTTVVRNMVLDGQVAIDRAVMQSRAEGRIISLDAVSATPSALFSALDRIERSGRMSLTSERPMIIRIERLKFLHPEDNGREFVFRKISLQLERSLGRTLLRALPEAAPDAAPEIELVRIVDDRQTTWQLASNGNWIPAWLIESLVPGIKAAGNEAVVAGTVELFWRDSGWSGTLSGVTIDRLDLASAVHGTFGQPLAGSATVVIDSGAFVDNRVCQLDVRLASGKGEMGHALVKACVESASMVSTIGEYAEGPVAFSRMSIGFRLKGHMISFSSLEDDNGAVLFSETGDRLLFVRNGQPLPMISLLQILSWPSDPSSPITRRTQDLANKLAWPPVPIPDLNLHRGNERHAGEDEPGQGTFFR